MWVEQSLGMMARRSAPRDWVEGKAPQASRLWLRVCAGPAVFLRSVLCQSPLPHSSVPGSSLVGFLKQELASGRALVPFPSQASPPFPDPFIASYILDMRTISSGSRKPSDFSQLFPFLVTTQNLSACV